MVPRCIGIIDKQKRDYMKRDLGLVRELLLKLEALPMEMYGTETIQPDDPRIAIEGHSEKDVAYHLELLQERGLIEIPDAQDHAAP
jgi:Hypothetical protein (DUF2513)